VSVICHSTMPYSSPMVMVLKKEGMWHMCLEFCALKKLTIKYKFPILVIDDLFDELSGAHYFTILDLCFGYQHIRMKEADIPKMTFQTHEGHYEFWSCPLACVIAPPLSKVSRIVSYVLFYSILS